MSDLLSAASLFLAVIGLLYSAWYGEITKAINLAAPSHKDDRGPAIRAVKTTYRNRALPLAVASVALAIVLTPDFVSIVNTASRIFLKGGVYAVKLFDAVRTMFCAIAVTSFGLAVHTSSLAWRARSHWKKLAK